MKKEEALALERDKRVVMKLLDGDMISQADVEGCSPAFLTALLRRKAYELKRHLREATEALATALLSQANPFQCNAVNQDTGELCMRLWIRWEHEPPKEIWDHLDHREHTAGARPPTILFRGFVTAPPESLGWSMVSGQRHPVLPLMVAEPGLARRTVAPLPSLTEAGEPRDTRHSPVYVESICGYDGPSVRREREALLLQAGFVCFSSGHDAEDESYGMGLVDLYRLASAAEGKGPIEGMRTGDEVAAWVRQAVRPGVIEVCGRRWGAGAG